VLSPSDGQTNIRAFIHFFCLLFLH
jgi:hypothetical protein